MSHGFTHEPRRNQSSLRETSQNRNRTGADNIRPFQLLLLPVNAQ
jgi:hypothetical protein